MYKFTQSSNFERRRSGGFYGTVALAAALLVCVGAGVSVMGAQTSTPPTSASSFQTPATSTGSGDLFSSSATEEASVPVTEASVVRVTPNFAEMMQYGGGQRKRYGRPRYRGNNTNGDGSSKYIFYGGAGLSQPIGNTWHYLTPSYGFEVGGGRQFSKHFAVPVEFNWDHFGFTKQTLNNQTTVYDALFGAGAVDGLLDGNSHIWSFSVEPTVTFYQGEAWGAYAEVGAGFYHKTATFTLPQTGQYCDPYYGVCYTYTSNQSFNGGRYVSNAPGFDGGFGITYKFSRFSGERFFAEARYVFVDNSQRTGVTPNNLNTAPANSTDFYPANSNRTTFIPIKVGIRF
jgi:hypothetical protein